MSLLEGSYSEGAVVRALKECQKAIDAGQSIDREAILKEYPSIRDELSACLDGLELLQPIKKLDATVSSNRSADSVGLSLSPSATLGDFRIEREIGRGGMGVVYEAEQLSVGRNVALKVLPYAAMLDKRQVARFQNEARAAATLEHPNIVPVYFVGNERGVYYYAMRLIDGKNLSEVLHELRGHAQEAAPLSLITSQLVEERVSKPDSSEGSRVDFEDRATIRDELDQNSTSLASHGGTRSKAYFESIARLAKQTAEALEFAHSHGIIHRDIKPANIMLDDLGDAWVTDFGLARIESDAGMTMTGDLVGTLRYMAPEQALAKRVTVDHRCDIYSLGATIYELLTLRPLFEGADRAELLKKIAFDEPTPPSRLIRGLPRDLETILLKSLAKHPDDRYASAEEMAQEFQRFVSNQPVKARRTSFPRRVRLWAQRNPTIALSAAIVCGVVLCSTALVGVLMANNERTLRTQQGEASAALAESLNEKIDQQTLALQAAQLAEARNYVNQIRLALAEWTFGDHTIAREALARTDEDLRDWEYQHLEQLFSSSIVSEQIVHDDSITSVQYSPDGQLIVTASLDSTLKLWNAETREIVRTLRGHVGGVNSFDFLPDGKRIASAGADGTIRIWEVESGRQIMQIDEVRSVDAVAVHPDSEILASGAGESLKFWDVEDGKLVRSFDYIWGNVTCVAFTTDGKYVSCGTDARIVDVWTVKEKLANNLSSGVLAGLAAGLFDQFPFEARIPSMQDRVSSVQFFHHDDPDIEVPLLIGTGYDNSFRLWDWEVEEEYATTKLHSGPVLCSDLSDDDTLLATGSQDRTILLWKITEERIFVNRLTSLRGHSAAVTGVDISPDGKYLASGGEDRKLIVWNLEEKTRPQDVWSVPPARPRDRTGPRDIDLITHETARPELEVDVNELQRTQLSPDGSKLARLISVDAEKDRPARIELWNVGERKTQVTLEVDARSVEWSDDAGLLATIDAEGKVQIWNSEDGSLARTLPSSTGNAATAAVFGPRDQIFVLDDQGIIVWNVNTGARLKVFPNRCKTIELGPVENQCALIDDEDRCMLLNLESGALSGPIQIKPSERYALAFSPDGKYLACGSSNDRDIRILEVVENSMVEKLLLTGHYEGIRDLAFLSNGKRLISGSMDNSAKLWDWENSEELLTLRGHNHPVEQVAVAPGGSAIISLDAGHMLHRWRTSSMP